jgi:integrase
MISERGRRIGRRRPRPLRGTTWPWATRWRWVWAPTGATWTATRSTSAAILALAKKADLPADATLYTLRHTFATLWLESREPVKVLQEILGHSRIDVTMNVYAHVLPHIQEDSMGRFERLFSDPAREHQRSPSEHS